MVRCDCGYVAAGSTLDDQVSDAQRHAWEAHGIEVTVEQVRAAAGAPAPPEGGTSG